ncbi:gsl3615 [Gloeobacter violaceus PCC 7421]|uniref:Gsl3615 protein n=1 Tax=Gloeobacter violaceus (strain ATCC 29082 / PCC 7421) TaxID=251221 RepID=Q7NFB1_GLOVI|nr:gsl3615 [Gloeobacter violaceus PCC 7421]
MPGEHPFFLQNKGWTAAERLEPGDRVQAAEGKRLRVAGLAAQEQTRKTYNLEVEGDPAPSASLATPRLGYTTCVQLFLGL